MAQTTKLQLVIEMQDKASNDMKKLQDRLTKTSKATSSFGSMVKRLAPFISGYALISGLKSTTKAFLVQEAAAMRLRSSFGFVGGITEETAKEMENFAKSLQKVTTFGDEAIISAQAQLGTFGLTTDQVKQLSMSLLDMAVHQSKATGTTMELEDGAKALGKAFTTGAGALTRYGVTMTDAEMKTFNMLDTQGKVDMMQKVLNDNYGGAAVNAAQTYGGQLTQLTNSFGDLKEIIGGAVINALSQLSGGWKESIENTGDQLDKSNALSKAFYSLAQVMLGVWSALKVVGGALAGIGELLWGVGTTVVGFAKDTIKAFKNVGWFIQGFASMVKKVFRGDFAGAFDDAKRMISTSFDSTISSAVNFGRTLHFVFEDMGNNVSNMWGHFAEAMDQRGFKPLESFAVDSAKGVGGAMTDAAEEASESAKKASDSLKDTVKEYQDTINDLVKEQKSAIEQATNDWISFKDSAGKQLDDLAERHKASVSSILDDIKKEKDSFKESQEESAQDFKTRMGEMVVDHEDKSKAIQIQIAEELKKGVDADVKKLDSLRKELNEEKRLINDGFSFIQKYNIDIDSVRNVAHMNEMERLEYEFKEKKRIAKEEHAERLKILDETLNAEKAEYKEYYAELKKELSDYKSEYETTLIDITESTRKEVAKMNVEWDKLGLKHITSPEDLKNYTEDQLVRIDGKIFAKRAKGGPVGANQPYMVGEQGPELFVPKNSGDIVPNNKVGGITINFNNVSVRNDDDLNSISQIVQAAISRQLKLTQMGV